MKALKKILIVFILIISLFVTSSLIYFLICCEKVVINGSSMETTLVEGQLGVYIKKKYLLQPLERFDIIVFDSYQDSLYIKRIIGMPGENVTINKNGDIYINNEKIQQDFLSSSQEYYATYLNQANVYMNVVLKEDEYFVLGDHRSVSYDSRFFGPIKESDIEGKYVLSYGKYLKYDSSTSNGSNFKLFPLEIY